MQFLPLFLPFLLHVCQFRSKRNSNLAEQSFFRSGHVRTHRKTCFSVFVSLPSYMIAISDWLWKRDVLNSTQPVVKLTMQLSRSWFTPLCMSAITLKCRFVERAPGKRGWKLHFGNALFARFSQPKTATRSLAKRINKTDMDATFDVV